MSTELTKTETTGVTANLYGGELPNLNDLQTLPLSLGGEYWTPTQDGESKRVFFHKIEDTPMMDFNGNPTSLECAFLLEQDEQLNTRTIYNGSAVLVGILKANIDSGFIKSGSTIEIVYKGKKKNKTNSFSSDRWEVYPLIIKQAK